MPGCRKAIFERLRFETKCSNLFLELCLFCAGRQNLRLRILNRRLCCRFKRGGFFLRFVYASLGLRFCGGKKIRDFPLGGVAGLRILKPHRIIYSGEVFLRCAQFFLHLRKGNFSFRKGSFYLRARIVERIDRSKRVAYDLKRFVLNCKLSNGFDGSCELHISLSSANHAGTEE